MIKSVCDIENELTRVEKIIKVYERSKQKELLAFFKGKYETLKWVIGDDNDAKSERNI